MASAFGHIAAALSTGLSFFPKTMRWRTGLMAAFCSIAPDLDVIPLFMGVPYASIYGHRGWTHSILFALLFGSLMGIAISRKTPDLRNALIFWMILATLSHPLLDMLTNGGLGVALFCPFDNSRLFFPWRPILVSPLGIGGFQSKWGLNVLKSEFIWIDLPCLVMIGVALLVRKKTRL
jgi:inner membrane protein